MDLGLFHGQPNPARRPSALSIVYRVSSDWAILHKLSKLHSDRTIYIALLDIAMSIIDASFSIFTFLQVS